MIKKVLKFICLLITFIVLTGIFAFITIHILIRQQPVVIVPDIKGKDINYAVDRLETLYLTPRIKKSEFSLTIPAQHVISQTPKPGEFVKKGRNVHITISRGKKAGIMPDLTGMTIDDAKAEIIKSGLKKGHISHTHHDKIPSGSIITSVPQPGIPVKSGTKTDILVSMGRWPQQRIMPDLSGLTLEDAVSSLSESNLKIDEIRTIYSPDFKKGIILAQTPLSGFIVDKDDKISLVLNQKNSPSIVSPVVGSRLVFYRIPPGLLRSHIKAELEIYDHNFIIYDDYYRPDEIITLLVPYDQEAVVNIFRDNKLVLEKKLLPFKSVTKKIHNFNQEM
ncbi:MAG: hypothetical protein CSA18_01475 [Deltaproteobacteria bacterium]|nr:MAG: hypothetical protein CSA18_01475 [Deltaproteobacteria bacterium]